MYLGYQNGIIKLYVEKLENLEFYPNTTWVKTEEEYILSDNGEEYIKKPENYEEVLAQRERGHYIKIKE